MYTIFEKKILLDICNSNDEIILKEFNYFYYSYLILNKYAINISLIRRAEHLFIDATWVDQMDLFK